MAKCDACGTTILLGGVKDGELRFCNRRCQQKGALITIANQIPEEIVRREAMAIHQGRCPKCNGVGPVDVHVSYRIWSAVFVTGWESRPRVSCHSCGVKSQLGDTFFCLFLGWWGIPWGVIGTPIQIGRNLVAFASPPGPNKPSDQLERSVRMLLAAQAGPPPLP